MRRDGGAHSAEARLLRAVRAFFAGLGVRGLPQADDLHLCVLERSELLARNGFEASSHRRQRCPLGLTCSMETTTVAPGGASASTRHIDAVCVLRALPKELCASTLAHEVGHVYLHLNDAASPTMAAPLCEGICELFAYLWLTRPSHPQGQQLVVRVRAMMENTDRVYGQGFRDALAAYYACDSSLVRLLSELHRTHRPPTGRLPTGGSPARLARHGGAAVGGAPGEAAGSGAAGGGAAAAKAASPGARAAAGVLVGAPAPLQAAAPCAFAAHPAARLADGRRCWGLVVGTGSRGGRWRLRPGPTARRAMMPATGAAERMYPPPAIEQTHLYP